MFVICNRINGVVARFSDEFWEHRHGTISALTQLDLQSYNI